jgi:hypothetical protein
MLVLILSVSLIQFDISAQTNSKNRSSSAEKDLRRGCQCLFDQYFSVYNNGTTISDFTVKLHAIIVLSCNVGTTKFSLETYLSANPFPKG